MYGEVFDRDLASHAAAPEVPHLLAIYEELAGTDGWAPFEALLERAGQLCGADLVSLAPEGSGNYRYLSYGQKVAAVTGQDLTGQRTRNFGGEIGAFFGDLYDRVLSERRPLLTIHRASLAASVHLWERLCLPCRSRDGTACVLSLVKPREFRTDLLNAVLEASREGLLALRAVRDASGAIVDAVILTANKAAAAVVGRSVEDLLDGAARKVLPGLVSAGLWDRCLGVIEARKPERFELQYSVDSLDTWFQVMIVPLGDGALISFSDVTELKYALFEMEAQKDQMEIAKRAADRARASAERAQKEAERARSELQAEVAARRVLEEELRRLAMTDGLTGALSRRGFDEAVHAAAAGARRHGYPLALIAIDVDHFKQVNDTHGHAAGDTVLKMAAAMLRDELRKNMDVLGRVGGEEFMVVVPHTTSADAAILAERLRTRLMGLRIPVADGAISITASFGVHELGPDGDQDQMMAGADEALYEAKRTGRNRVVVRRPELDPMPLAAPAAE